jgi:2-amino-4-hydroxy-6-hydroxymethyldihydropteridine diphosphokinase
MTPSCNKSQQAVWVGVGLGSNQGNREAFLDFAVERLRLLADPPGSFRESSRLTTKPVGCPPGSPDFRNAVVVFQSSLPPMDLLDHLQSLEQEAGRPARRAKDNSPRTLDLDLLFHGETVMDHPRLSLPHPLMLQRDFVRFPLLEIMPDFESIIYS